MENTEIISVGLHITLFQCSKTIFESISFFFSFYCPWKIEFIWLKFSEIIHFRNGWHFSKLIQLYINYEIRQITAIDKPCQQIVNVWQEKRENLYFSVSIPWDFISDTEESINFLFYSTFKTNQGQTRSVQECLMVCSWPMGHKKYCKIVCFFFFHSISILFYDVVCFFFFFQRRKEWNHLSSLM